MSNNKKSKKIEKLYEIRSKYYHYAVFHQETTYINNDNTIKSQLFNIVDMNDKSNRLVISDESDIFNILRTHDLLRRGNLDNEEDVFVANVILYSLYIIRKKLGYVKPSEFLYLFVDEKEYTNSTIRLHGLDIDQSFDNLSSDYLLHYLRDTPIIYSAVFNYSGNDIDSWQDIADRAEAEMLKPKPNIIISDFDDFMFIGESIDSWWIYWFHISGRDLIGRVSKASVFYKEDIIKCVENAMMHFNVFDGKYTDEKLAFRRLSNPNNEYIQF